MADLIRVTRGSDEADIRPEWLDEWRSWGWDVPGNVAGSVLTRESIAAMDKADVLDLLDMHGWDGDRRLRVDKLRAALIATVFVDL